MQVNHQVVPTTITPTGTQKTPPKPRPEIPTGKPPQVSPKTSGPEPIGSQQETHQIQQHVTETPTETIQTQVQTLEKTEKFKKSEDTIFSEVKLDAPPNKLGDMIAKKTQQTVPPELLSPTQQQPSETTPVSGQQPVNELGVGGVLLPTPNGLVARFRLSDRNIADTGLTAVLSGGFAVINQESHLDDGRVLLVRARQVDVNVGVSLKGAEDPLPIGGSLNVGFSGSSDVAFARKLKEGESLIQVRDTEPPKKSEIQADPLKALGEGDEIAYRGMLKVSVKAGAVEPHSHVKFSVGGSVENEFITSIKRQEGDPPMFRLHIEPGNRKVDVNASVGWGPFSVTGGGGYASTVHYEFEMTPAALSKFMKDGKLPKIPDPNQYLRSMDSLSDKKKQKLLEVFKQEHNGVKLVTFGATKSLEGYIEASATVAKAKTSSTRMEAIYIRSGDILHEDVHTMVASHSAWFHGELKTSLGLTQANRFKLEEGSDPTKEYVGLEATFKVGDTQTSESDLIKRVEHANALLGTVHDKEGKPVPPLEIPTRSDGKWGASSLSLKASITPEVLGKLEELGATLISRESQRTSTEDVSVIPMINFMKSEHGVSRTDMESMLKDIHAISQDPKLQGNTDEIRREQGIRVAAFLASGYTSHVGDEELKRVATLQRLVGPTVSVVEVKFSSDIHTRKIDGLAIEGFLASKQSEQLSEMTQTLPSSQSDLVDLKSRITGDPWDRFNVGAQKLKSLQQIREDLVADKTLDPQEKTNLLKKVDEFLDGLDAEISRQLDTPEGRTKVTKGLMEAGQALPKKLQSLYSSPEKMYDNPAVKGEFLDMVLMATVRDMGPHNTSEVSGLIREISRVDKGPIGMEHVFKLLNSVKEFSPELQGNVIREVGAQAFASMVPRMTDDQKWSLYHEIIPQGFPDQPKTLKSIENAITYASQSGALRFKDLNSKLDQIEKEVTKLGRKQETLLERTSGPSITRSKQNDLMEHFKDTYKDLEQPLDSVKDKIADDFILLGGLRHQLLSQKSEQLSQEVEHLIGGIDRMGTTQRKALFDEVLKQDIMGDVSQSILKRLIGSSEDQGELIGFAQAIELKARKTSTSTTDRISSPFRNNTKGETREGLQQRLLEIQLKLS